jgi:nitronate monooxygenase
LPIVLPYPANFRYAAGNVVHAKLFTGLHGNYPGPSIAAAGLDPNNLPIGDKPI